MSLVARPWIVAVILGSIAGCADFPEEKLTREVEDYNAKAEQGYAMARFDLVFCYEPGEDIAKSRVQTASQYRKVAELGDATAQFYLGFFYERGLGLAQDYVQAVAWYRKAAAKGYVSAQFNLGLCYERGAGVAKDLAQAAAWFRKGAEQGYAAAQSNLGLCYATGAGVAKDEIEAYAYWNLAGVKAGVARRNLAILEKKMSPDQIAAGKKRTKELQNEIEEKFAAKRSSR